MADATAKKILVIEDSQSTAALVAAFLNRSGYETLIAPDAMLGVQECIRWRPDLVLLDLMLPAGGGVSVLRNVRQSRIVSHIPFLVLTGSNDPLMRKQILEYGVKAFLKKPYEQDDLLALIQQTLSSSQVSPNETPRS